MKRSALILLLLSLALVNLSGCVFIVGGAAGALGAYGLSKDTIAGDTDTPYDNLWNSAMTISRARGTVTKEDNLQGIIELKADTSRVWIQLIRITQMSTKVQVSARKHHLPNLSLAQDIYIKILEQAK